MTEKKRVIWGIVLILIVIFGGLLFYGVINFPFDIDYSQIYSRVSEIFGVVSTYVVDLFNKIPWEMDWRLVGYVVGGFIVFVFLMASFIKFVRSRKKKKVVVGSRLNLPKKSKSETDLDILYNLIKEKKSLNLDSISKMFKIPKEKSLEWVKILENHDLVVIEYPAFSVPVVKINEKAITHRPREVVEKKKDKTHKLHEVVKNEKDKTHRSREVVKNKNENEKTTKENRKKVGKKGFEKAKKIEKNRKGKKPSKK